MLKQRHFSQSKSVLMRMSCLLCVVALMMGMTGCIAAGPQETEAVETTENTALFQSFTYQSIARTLTPEGYRFDLHDSGEAAETGFRIYERDGGELHLLREAVGTQLIFEEIDENTSYVLTAYMRNRDGEEKEIDFYYLYSRDMIRMMADVTARQPFDVEKLMEGFYEGYDISLPLNWELPEISNRGLKTNVQSFRVMDVLLEDYWVDGNQEKAERFLKYLESFLDQYPVVPQKEDDALWSDFCVSRRVQFMCEARLILDRMISNDLLRKMEDHLVQCAQLLKSPDHYKAKHNHGMFQDFSLLVYLNTFGYLQEDADADRALALRRVKEYFDFSIAPDGVHREHSPAYHSDILFYIIWFQKYCAAFGDPYAEELAVLESKMLDFYIDLVMPDFTWPVLGDSYGRISNKTVMGLSPKEKWIRSKGQKGTPPEENMAVYPDGGYAIMRSDWEDLPEDATYMILTAATHSTAHKHQDDLNFVLYHKGPLITEGGKRNYNYNEPGTVYAYSSYAHNVLFVNNEGWKMSATNHPVLEKAAYNTRLIDYGQSDEAMWVTGRSERWETVTQERTLHYNHSTGTVWVQDVLTAAQPENIRLIYHIADGVDIRETENGWVLRRNGQMLAEVTVEASQDIKLTTLKGSETDGEFKTWLFDADHIESPREGGLLIVDMRAAQGENTVSLKLDLK